jgi:hypothetical protein
VVQSEDPTQIRIWATDLREETAKDGKKKRLAAKVKLLRLGFMRGYDILRTGDEAPSGVHHLSGGPACQQAIS